HQLAYLVVVPEEAVFHQGNEEGTGHRSDLIPGIHIPQSGGIAAAADGGGGADDSDFTVSGGFGRSPTGTAHHPGVGDRKPGGLMSGIGTADGAAGGQKEFHILLEKE